MVPRVGCVLALLASAVLAAGPRRVDQGAARPSANPLAALGYRPLDFTRGGRVTAVAGIPAQPLAFYFGSTGGGVWKTTDAGVTWTNVSDGAFDTGSIGAIAIADSNPNIVYVGTGSACPRNNVSVGVGMYRSRDGGRTWTHAGLRDAGQIGAVSVDPADPDRVFVAVLGNVFGSSTERGVFRSRDGGDTWDRALFVDDKTGAVDLAMDPRNPRVLYAAMWAFDRKPWGISSTSRDSGIYKTDDGGETWRHLGEGLPSNVGVDRSAVAVSPSKPGRVWALLDTERYDGGLYRSDDAGMHWERVNAERELVQRAFYYTHLFADPADPDTVYVLNVQFHKSVDGGKTFQRVQTPHVDHHDLWINPRDPQKMIVGNDGGAAISVNGGASWSTQQNQPTAEIYRVSVDEQYPYWIYGAQQDASTVAISSARRASEPWFPVGGTEAAHVAVDPFDPFSVWATAYWGEVTRIDTRTRNVDATHPYPEWLTGRRAGDVKFRYNWSTPLRVSRHVKGTVWTASQFIHRTRDGGRSWEIVSPDLTGTGDSADNEVDELIRRSASFEPWGTIINFEESRTTPGLLWSGSDDGLVYVTRDDGASWSNVTPQIMPQRATVNTIDPSAHAPGRAHVAAYRYMLNDFKPYVYQTNDFGTSWRLLTDGANGIPSTHPVRIVREDPQRKGLLYAGTEFGIYFSIDDGARWQPLQLNLPVTPVTDLAIHRDDLVVTTQGRGFWILDDLTPLREIAAGESMTSNRVLPIRDAHRGSSESVSIWYTLSGGAPAPVSIEIRDRAGRIVASARGTAADRAAARGGPTASAGLNRFDWNLRYAPPFQVPPGVGLFAALGPGFAGPLAPPGTYDVTISSGSWKGVQPLKIGLTPGARATQADYDAQLELALRIGAQTRTLYEMLATVREIRSQAVARQQQPAASDAALRRELEALLNDIGAIEEALAQTRATGSQDTAPSKLDSQFIGLYGRVIAHDGRPTEPEQIRFRDIDPMLSKEEAALDVLLRTRLAAVNQLLQARGLGAIRGR